MNHEELSTICARCGKIAEGYAFIGDDRYCHPDDGVDCYTLASHELTSSANQAFIEKAQAPTDEEREALSNFLFSVYEHGSQPNALREADAILSFLASIRPAQTEPTDAQVQRVREAVYAQSRREAPVKGHSPGYRPTEKDTMPDTPETERLRRKLDNLNNQIRLANTALGEVQSELGNVAAAVWNAIDSEAQAVAGGTQPEPEYEYSWEGVDDEGDGWIMDEWFATVAGAERYADSRMGNWVRTDKGKLIRRVKAGAWEPVPKEEQS